MEALTHVTQPPAAPPRPADAHKGTFGTVVVVGGSATMMGAPALCASAALRAGVGLCKVATLPAVLPVALGIEPGATGVLLDDHNADDSAAAIDEADPDHKAALAVGPGIGKSAWAGELVGLLLRGRRAVVLDADGLSLLAATGQPRPAGIDGDCVLVMTPHPGEFARLAAPLGIVADPTDPAARPTAAAELARAHRAVVLLKGQGTVVCDGRRVYVNHTGNPALATAGSGDVLTGILGALLAQHMPPFEAAALAAHLHGLAADLWARRNGPSGLTARDLAALVPEAFNQHRQG